MHNVKRRTSVFSKFTAEIKTRDAKIIQLLLRKSKESLLSSATGKLMVRTSPTQNLPTRVISFGNTPLHTRVVNFFVNMVFLVLISLDLLAPNLQIYQLPIPAAEIFHRTPPSQCCIQDRLCLSVLLFRFIFLFFLCILSTVIVFL